MVAVEIRLAGATQRRTAERCHPAAAHSRAGGAADAGGTADAAIPDGSGDTSSDAAAGATATRRPCPPPPIPLWPGCVPVTVTGDIVRRRPTPATAG
jgi:hypothetical protein